MRTFAVRLYPNYDSGTHLRRFLAGRHLWCGHHYLIINQLFKSGYFKLQNINTECAEHRTPVGGDRRNRPGSWPSLR